MPAAAVTRKMKQDREKSVPPAVIEIKKQNKDDEDVIPELKQIDEFMEEIRSDNPPNQYDKYEENFDEDEVDDKIQAYKMMKRMMEDMSQRMKELERAMATKDIAINQLQEKLLKNK